MVQMTAAQPPLTLAAGSSVVTVSHDQTRLLHPLAVAAPPRIARMPIEKGRVMVSRPRSNTSLHYGRRVPPLSSS